MDKSIIKRALRIVTKPFRRKTIHDKFPRIPESFIKEGTTRAPSPVVENPHLKDAGKMAEWIRKEHPEWEDGITRATFAYHAERHERGAHLFTNASRESYCTRCGRSRENVRWGWDGQPPECAKWEPIDIEGTIRTEEEAYIKLLASAESIVKREYPEGITNGAQLARLHSTFGIQPDVAVDISGASEKLLEEYNAERDKERELSKSAHKKTVVMAVTND